MRYTIPFLLQDLEQRREACERAIENLCQHGMLEAIDPMSVTFLRNEADIWVDLYDIVQRAGQGIM